MSTPGHWREAAPAPRGPYPPFPQARPPPPNFEPPFAGAPRRSYYAAAPIPGFYSPALAQPAPGLSPGRGVPAFPRPELPAALMPGQKPSFAVTRSQSDEYFFQNGTSIPFSHHRHAQTAPIPPVPRKPNDLSHPPLPPKPSLSPHMSMSPRPPSLPHGAAPPRPPSYPEPPRNLVPSAPPPPPNAESNDILLHRVLEESSEAAQESARQRQQAILSEQAELERALEASLRISSPRSGAEPDWRSSVMTASPEQGPSALPSHSPVLDISLQAIQQGGRRGSASPYVDQQILDDEALARQLALEEEQLAEEERSHEPNGHSDKGSPPVLADGPPQYDEAVSLPPPMASPAIASPASYHSGLALHSPQNVAGPSPSSSPRMPSLGRSISDKPVPPRMASDEKRVSRTQSLTESAPSASTTLLAPTTKNGRPASSASSEWEHSDDETKSLTPSTTASYVSDVPSNTQYLDTELLAGLSMGFSTPTIDPTPRPFAGVIPNVIALPYGRCPPFHIKAPSWRTLLKLMARLSGTRLEPTMEAMAVVKTEMKLRIVVSFVKVHHASDEWHTVLYMTIDHPIPPNAPANWRYKNGDTSTLPWSYTLSQMPPFLRDGADAALSKFYTIPITPETPYPTLPISFPNLATYLASALENSRAAMHDSSSGVRRLAKHVDQYYPSDHIVLEDAPERSGMRQRLKNLVGIGNRPQRDRNAEMYELVTPFVPDDYGR